MTQPPHTTYRVHHKAPLARILVSKSTNSDTPHETAVNQCCCHSPLSSFAPSGCSYSRNPFLSVLLVESGLESKTNFQQAIIIAEFLVIAAEHLFKSPTTLDQALRAGFHTCSVRPYLTNNPASYKQFFLHQFFGGPFKDGKIGISALKAMTQNSNLPIFPVGKEIL